MVRCAVMRDKGERISKNCPECSRSKHPQKQRRFLVQLRIREVALQGIRQILVFPLDGFRSAVD